MTDLVEDLLVALEPYDTTMASWSALRTSLPNMRFAVSTDQLDRALYAYASEQIVGLRLVNGTVESDAFIDDLPGEPLKNILVQAGRLQPSALVDALIVYGAHLAALTSYRGAVWARITDAVVTEATFQELTR